MSSHSLKERADKVVAELRAIAPEVLDAAPAHLRIEAIETATTLSAFADAGGDPQFVERAERLCMDMRAWLERRVD
jgi:hypothetical protein